jgi:hypothetical protein
MSYQCHIECPRRLRDYRKRLGMPKKLEKPEKLTTDATKAKQRHHLTSPHLSSLRRGTTAGRL